MKIVSNRSQRCLSIILLVNIAVSPLAGMHMIPRALRLVGARLHAPRTIKPTYRPTRSYTKLHPTVSKQQFYKTATPWWRSWWNWLWRIQKPRTIHSTKRWWKPTAAFVAATGAYACHQPQRVASVWEARAQGKEVSRRDMLDTFVADCKRYAADNYKIPTHNKNDQSVRIATYNVHMWRDPYGANNFDGIMATIKATHADIMLLQEVTLFNKTAIERALRDAGYRYIVFGKTIDNVQRPCGNMIISKYPFTQKPTVKIFDADARAGYEKRCFIKTDIALPQNNTITLYGTHLDVWDATESKRTEEIVELTRDAKHQSGNILIGADFNAVRSQDYQYQVQNKSVWDLLNTNHKKRTGIPVPTTALTHLEQAGFIDTFMRAGNPSPRFTVWSGTVVDFLYLNKQWNLPMLGSYVYYSTASDHMPVIMDLVCKR